VAVPVKTQAEKPEAIRPAKIGTRDPANTNRGALAAEKAIPIGSTGFPPTSSERFPEDEQACDHSQA
jgi:hypothetical protein